MAKLAPGTPKMFSRRQVFAIPWKFPLPGQIQSTVPWSFVDELMTRTLFIVSRWKRRFMYLMSSKLSRNDSDGAPVLGRSDDRTAEGRGPLETPPVSSKLTKMVPPALRLNPPAFAEATLLRPRTAAPRN